MTPDLPPLPERDDLNMRASSTHVYTAAQMRTYAAEAVRVARLQALEDAARVADNTHPHDFGFIASAIRALKDRK